MDLTATQELIEQECYHLRDLLLDKNRKYGDSAISPVRIFSSADAVEQINVRIDDKLSRIASNQGDDTEDAELDLIGYLVLKRVAMRAGRIVEHLANSLDREAQQAAATLIPNIATDDEEWQQLPGHIYPLADDPDQMDGQQIDQQIRAAHHGTGATIPTTEEMGYIDDPERESRVADLGFIVRTRRDQAVDGVTT